MADVVFHVTQFGKCAVVTLGDEDGVVAESAVTVWLCRDVSFDDSFKFVCLSAAYEGDDRAEACPSVFDPFQACEQFVHVGHRVMSFASGIACRIHPRFAAESLYFQPRVVGKAVRVEMFVDIACLEQGVFLQCRSRLRDVGMATDVAQAQQLDTFAEHGRHLFQFVCIVGRKNEFFFHKRCFLMS